MNTSHRTLMLASVLGCLSLTSMAQTPATTSTAARPPQVDVATLNYRLAPRAVADGVWVLEGAVEDFSRSNGCNIINTGVIATPQGTWVVNTGPSFLYGQQQRQAVLQLLTPHKAGAVQQVLNLNLHPDYFFGNQAWRDVPTSALAGSIQGMQAEGGAYADNAYTLCGDWMKGTESTPAKEAIAPGRFKLGTHDIELWRSHGHTADDLVLIDHTSGVVFAGGLVFTERVPTVPHAKIEAWLAALDALEAKLKPLKIKALVPSHGPVRGDVQGLHQTRDYLRWLHQLLQDSAKAGLDLSEVIALPVPARFARWGAIDTEYPRNVISLYPAYERAALMR
jgi:quinoprotein relay system zinc metallohydrolase 1